MNEAIELAISILENTLAEQKYRYEEYGQYSPDAKERFLDNINKLTIAIERIKQIKD